MDNFNIGDIVTIISPNIFKIFHSLIKYVPSNTRHTIAIKKPILINFLFPLLGWVGTCGIG